MDRDSGEVFQEAGSGLKKIDGKKGPKPTSQVFVSDYVSDYVSHNYQYTTFVKVVY